MKIHHILTIIVLSFISICHADDSQKPIDLFGLGTKPIQIGLGKDGLERKGNGYICDVSATLGNAKYSEWGETEDDARTIVLKKCSANSGVLLCKKDRVTCREDK